MSLKLKAEADDQGRRLDRVLRKALEDMPLSAIHRQLRKGLVLVNGKKAEANYLVNSGDEIRVKLKEMPVQPKAKSQGRIMAGPPLSILFEGEGLLVLNKAAGLAVHGTKGSEGGAYGNSLAEQVLEYLKPKLPPSLSFKPGPLHRLDKPSSGVIVFSTNLEGARNFSALLQKREIKKYYLALAEGKIVKEEIWRDDLTRDREKKKTYSKESDYSAAGAKAKAALTRIKTLASNTEYSLILAEIETGRTHQIRAQAAARGHPLLGDIKYGGKKNKGGFLLHAWRMEIPAFISAGGKAGPLVIEAPLPDYFLLKLNELFGEDLVL